MKKFLVSNIYSPNNAGDRAIVYNMLAFVDQNWPNSSVVLQSKYHRELASHFNRMCLPEPVDLPPQKNSFHASVIALLSLAINLFSLVTWKVLPRFFSRYLPLSSTLKEAVFSDYVFVAGGNYLFSSNKSFVSRTMLVHLLNILFYTFVTRRVVIFPQTIGPFYRKYEISITKYVLSRCKLVSLRDMESFQFLQKLDLSNCLVCPDIAFYSLSVSRTETQRPKKAIITVMDWEWSVPPSMPEPYSYYRSNYLEALTSVIASLQSRGIMVSIGCHVSTSTHSDLKICKEIASQFSLEILDMGAMEMQDIFSVYDAHDLIIGTRMHSCILGISAGKPTIGIGYQPKCFGTFSLLGLSDFVFDIYDLKNSKFQASVEDVVDKYSISLKQFQSVRHELSQSFEDLASEIEKCS